MLCAIRIRFTSRFLAGPAPTLRPEIDRLMELAASLTKSELPALAGELAHASAVVLARIATPDAQEPVGDEALTIHEAAERLQLSVSYLYRHDFAFTIREGRTVRFSRSGIDRYLRSRNSLTTRRQTF